MGMHTVLTGQGVLENVQLRPGALDQTQLPVAISEGKVGKLRLKVCDQTCTDPCKDIC